MLGQESLEYVDKFSYLDDMIGARGFAGDAVRAGVRCAWDKFNKLKPCLTVRRASLILRAKIYAMHVQCDDLWQRFPTSGSRPPVGSPSVFIGVYFIRPWCLKYKSIRSRRPPDMEPYSVAVAAYVRSV